MENIPSLKELERQFVPKKMKINRKHSFYIRYNNQIDKVSLERHFVRSKSVIVFETKPYRKHVRVVSRIDNRIEIHFDKKYKYKFKVNIDIFEYY